MKRYFPISNSKSRRVKNIEDASYSTTPHESKRWKIKIPLHSWVNKATTFILDGEKKFCERKSISKIRRIKKDGNVDIFRLLGNIVEVVNKILVAFFFLFFAVVANMCVTDCLIKATNDINILKCD